jgi:rRNA maturation protein Nop10
VELHFEAQERFWHRKVPLLTYPTIMALPRPECKVSIDTFDINEERIIHNLSFAQSSLNHSLSVMAVNFTLYDSHNTQKDLILKTENCLINWDKSNNKQLFFITMDFRACIPGEYRVVNRTYCIKCKSKEQYTLANNSEKCERCDNQIMICEGIHLSLKDRWQNLCTAGQVLEEERVG